MEQNNNLTESLEDYLETIYLLECTNRVARVKDIAERLEVKMPSVTGALKNLKDKGLINYEKNSFISLTQDGLKIACRIDRKHKILNEFFTEIIGLDEQRSDKVSCSIEHILDIKTIEKLSNLINFLEENVIKDDKPKWMNILEGKSK
ncbi:MAG: metal-dependent transcriptional regulator [Spirochaetales bacterium]|nr:metal-dependent transcriptional regulator [Spirochaetales bacterium]